MNGKFDHKSSIENADLITFERFSELNKTFLKNGFIEWFIFGNANE